MVRQESLAPRYQESQEFVTHNMEKIITMVYPTNIENVWKQSLPLLIPAINLHNTHSAEDVYKACMCGNAQLWIQWTDKVEAAVITEFVSYPKSLWFRLWLAGALKGSEILWDKFWETLSEFAKKNNCKGIEDCGREGWIHYAPKNTKTFSMRRVVI